MLIGVVRGVDRSKWLFIVNTAHCFGFKGLDIARLRTSHCFDLHFNPTAKLILCNFTNTLDILQLLLRKLQNYLSLRATSLVPFTPFLPPACILEPPLVAIIFDRRSSFSIYRMSWLDVVLLSVFRSLLLPSLGLFLSYSTSIAIHKLDKKYYMDLGPGLRGSGYRICLLGRDGVGPPYNNRYLKVPVGCDVQF